MQVTAQVLSAIHRPGMVIVDNTVDGHEDVPMGELTLGRMTDREVLPILDQVRVDAAELRQALLED